MIQQILRPRHLLLFHLVVGQGFVVIRHGTRQIATLQHGQRLALLNLVPRAHAHLRDPAARRSEHVDHAGWVRFDVRGKIQIFRG